MILSFADPALERMYRTRFYPVLPDVWSVFMIRRAFHERYRALDMLAAARGLEGIDREAYPIEKTGPEYRISVPFGHLCFRLSGHDFSDVRFDQDNQDQRR